MSRKTQRLRYVRTVQPAETVLDVTGEVRAFMERDGSGAGHLATLIERHGIGDNDGEAAELILRIVEIINRRAGRPAL